jgi:magnesium-transporting ATPase (P-type)
MGSIARSDAQEAVLPDPEHAFLNAQIAAQQRAREKALRPLDIAEFVVRIMVILALAAGVLWAWFGLRSLAASSLPAYLHVSQPLYMSAAALVTSLLTLVFTKLVQPMLIEE